MTDHKANDLPNTVVGACSHCGRGGCYGRCIETAAKMLALGAELQKAIATDPDLKRQIQGE